METLLSSVLSSLIGQYVQNLDADAVTDSLWAKGALKLRSLQLNTEVLALDTEAASACVLLTAILGPAGLEHAPCDGGRDPPRGEDSHDQRTHNRGDINRELTITLSCTCRDHYLCV